MMIYLKAVFLILFFTFQAHGSEPDYVFENKILDWENTLNGVETRLTDRKDYLSNKNLEQNKIKKEIEVFKYCIGPVVDNVFDNDEHAFITHQVYYLKQREDLENEGVEWLKEHYERFESNPTNELDSLHNIMCFTKDLHYHEENEYRLVFQVPKNNSAPGDHRKPKQVDYTTENKPHINVFEDQKNQNLGIKRIILSPYLNRDKNREVQNMLNNYSFINIDIVNSSLST